MKISIILTVIFLLFSQFVLGQNKSFIAVLDLEAEGVTLSESRIISERLRSALFKTNNFIVLERDKMTEILKEQGFQQSGCTTNDCIVAMGKLIGVEEIISGSLGKIGDMFTLNVRIIDIKSGRVLDMAVDDCKCDIEDVLIQSTERIARQFSKQEKEQAKNVAEENAVFTPDHYSKSYMLSPVLTYGDNIITGYGVGIRADIPFNNMFTVAFQYVYHFGGRRSYFDFLSRQQVIKGRMWYAVSELGYMIPAGDFVFNPAVIGGLFYINREYSDYAGPTFNRTGLCYGFNMGTQYVFTNSLSAGLDFKGIYYSDRIDLYTGSFSLNFGF